jgi:hypothetical protein
VARPKGSKLCTEGRGDRNVRVREVWKVSACQSSHIIRVTAVVDSCGGERYCYLEYSV